MVQARAAQSSVRNGAVGQLLKSVHLITYSRTEEEDIGDIILAVDV